MDKVTEDGYMFAYTYNLEEDILFRMIEKEISKLDLEIEDKNFTLKINIVKNKEDKKLGYSYFWIDNVKIFNALVGLNYDGSRRIKKTTEIIEKEIDFSLDLNTCNWGDMVEEETVTIENLKPLIIFPELNLSDEDKDKFRIYDDDIKFNMIATTVTVNYNSRNSLFCKRVPSWLESSKIKKYFETYEKDKRVHRKKKETFTYPIVKVKNSIANVIFSNLYPHTASFVFNMSRKVIFKDKNRECLLIFNQNIKRND